jgi:hypothetical protein
MVRGATARGALARGALVLLALLGGCSRGQRCREAPPAFELDLSVAPAIGARVARLRVAISLPRIKDLEVYNKPTWQLADGASSLVVALGEPERVGFSVAITAAAYSGSGGVIAGAEGTFAGSGDACNRFQLSLRPTVIPGADAQVDAQGDLSRADAPEKDAGWAHDQPRPDARAPDKQPPKSCTALYGAAVGFQLCDEGPTSCRFYAEMSAYPFGGCDRVCKTHGGACLGANSAKVAKCAVSPVSCQAAEQYENCVCTRF